MQEDQDRRRKRRKTGECLQAAKRTEGNSSVGEQWLHRLGEMMKTPPEIETAAGLTISPQGQSGWRIGFSIRVMLDGIPIMTVFVDRPEWLLFFRMFMDGEDLYFICIDEVHLIFEGDGTSIEWQSFLEQLSPNPLGQSIQEPAAFRGYKFRSCEPYSGRFIFAVDNPTFQMEFSSSSSSSSSYSIPEHERVERETLMELYEGCEDTLLLSLPIADLPLSQLRILVREPGAPACYLLSSIVRHIQQAVFFERTWPSNRMQIAKEDVEFIMNRWNVRKREIVDSGKSFIDLWYMSIGIENPNQLAMAPPPPPPPPPHPIRSSIGRNDDAGGGGGGGNNIASVPVDHHMNEFITGVLTMLRNRRRQEAEDGDGDE